MLNVREQNGNGLFTQECEGMWLRKRFWENLLDVKMYQLWKKGIKKKLMLMANKENCKLGNSSQKYLYCLLVLSRWGRERGWVGNGLTGLSISPSAGACKLCFLFLPTALFLGNLCRHGAWLPCLYSFRTTLSKCWDFLFLATANRPVFRRSFVQQDPACLLRYLWVLGTSQRALLMTYVTYRLPSLPSDFWSFAAPTRNPDLKLYLGS